MGKKETEETVAPDEQVLETEAPVEEADETTEEEETEETVAPTSPHARRDGNGALIV